MTGFSALWWLGVCLAAAPLLGAQATARLRSPERLARQQPPQAPAAPQQDMAHPQNTNAGIYAFTSHCAGCHDTGKGGAGGQETAAGEPRQQSCYRRHAQNAEFAAKLSLKPSDPLAKSIRNGVRVAE